MDDRNRPAVFLGVSSGAKTMADGTLRVQVDFSPADAVDAFTAFGSPSSPVFVGRSTNEAALEADRPKEEQAALPKPKGPFGKFAQQLVRSQFFKSPDIWAGIGTDLEYLDWVSYQKSARSGEFSEYDPDSGVGRCVAAHVRRVDLGSGTAIKPEFSAIPLTDAEHKLAHQEGDHAVGDEDWWRRMRIKYAEKWAYETLKSKMGYDSYTDMAPHRLVAWASQRELTHYLPLAYINAENEIDQKASEA